MGTKQVPGILLDQLFYANLTQVHFRNVLINPTIVGLVMIAPGHYNII